MAGSVKGCQLVVGVYCPEKLPDVEEDFFKDWDFDDMVAG